MPTGLRRLCAQLALAAALPAGALAALPYLTADLAPGPADAGIDSLRAAGTQAVFRRGGTDLWRSDGGEAAALVTGPVDDVTSHRDRFFFTRPSPTPPNEELWSTDGTGAGTALLLSIATVSTCPALGGPCTFVAPHLDGFVSAGPLLYFRQSGWAIWRSDGTTGGTVLVADYSEQACSTGCLCCFSVGPELAPRTAVNERLYFGAYNPFLGPMGLFVAGPGGATQVVPSPTPAALAGVRGTAFFTAEDAAGASLWRSDGAGTLEVTDLGARAPSALTAAGGLLYFVLDAGTPAAELWRSDGTAAGTFALAAGDAADLTAAGARLFFRHSDPGGDTLWTSDGTAAGTLALPAAAPAWLTDVGGTLYFSATDAAAGGELWQSDGTPAGTVRVDDIVPGPDGSQPADLAAGCGRLYFTATTPAAGRELWALDVSPGSCPTVEQASCAANADCNDGDACTGDVCNAQTGCTALAYSCCADAECDDGDACTTDHCGNLFGCTHVLQGGLDGVTCLLGASGSEAARCPDETLPLRIARRLDRVRLTVARAEAATRPAGEARRLRSAIRKLGRVLVRIDREAANGTISGPCRDALADLATTARERLQILYDAP